MNPADDQDLKAAINALPRAEESPQFRSRVLAAIAVTPQRRALSRWAEAKGAAFSLLMGLTLGGAVAAGMVLMVASEQPKADSLLIAMIANPATAYAQLGSDR